MPQTNIPTGGLARSIHVQQIINWLRGSGQYAEAMSLTGYNSSIAYALTVANPDTSGSNLGLGLSVMDSDVSIRLLSVANAGMVVRPRTANQSIFKVLNYDGTTAFEVSYTGVSTGNQTFATDTNTMTLTNKTISGGIITSSRVSDWLDVTQGASSPSNPSANRLRLFSNQGDSQLRSLNSSGTEVVIADLSTAQTMTNKTLTTPSVDGPVLNSGVTTGYVETVVTASAPSNPSANRYRLYWLSSDAQIRHRDSSGTVKVLVDTDTTQTLSNKIAAALNVSNYLRFSQTSAPGTPSSEVYLYALSAGTDLRYKANSDTERTIADLDQAQTFTNKTLTAALVSNYLRFTLTTAPGTPSGEAYLYALTGQTDVRYKANSSTERTIADLDQAQTFTNKTLTAALVSNYLRFTQTSAPGTPSNEAYLYALTGQTDLRYKANSGTERTIADLDQTQTLSNKTLTSPTMSSPTVSSGGVKLTIGSAPTGASGSAWIYYKTGATSTIAYKAGDDTERVIVDTTSTQSLSNKSFDAGLALTTPSLTGPAIENYSDHKQNSATPGAGAATYTRFWFKNDNNAYFTLPGGTEQLVLTNSNSTSVAASGFARGLSLGSL